MDPMRPAHDLDAEQERWRSWIDAVCADLGVPNSAVDVPLIHALSKQVAHGMARPMAPVSTFILGLAVARADGSPAATERLAALIAAHTQPGVPQAGD